MSASAGIVMQVKLLPNHSTTSAAEQREGHRAGGVSILEVKTKKHDNEKLPKLRNNSGNSFTTVRDSETTTTKNKRF